MKRRAFTRDGVKLGPSVEQIEFGFCRADVQAASERRRVLRRDPRDARVASKHTSPTLAFKNVPDGSLAIFRPWRPFRGRRRLIFARGRLRYHSGGAVAAQPRGRASTHEGVGLAAAAAEEPPEPRRHHLV